MASTSSTELDKLSEFFKSVVTTPQGYFELGVRNGSWAQHWYAWPHDLSTICDHALSSDGDVYFTAHLFGSKNSHKENVLPSRTLQADLDHADVQGLALTPTWLNQTSPGRHQGFWLVTSDFDSLKHQEELSKRLTYSIDLCDHSGWSLGHKVRVPYTKNYKYKDAPGGHPVEIVKATTKKYTIDELELLPIPESKKGVPQPDEAEQFIVAPPLLSKSGAYEIIESIKDHLSAKVYAEYLQDGPSSDRSTSLFALMLQCYKAGLSRDEVYWVAYNSPNNKFLQDQRFNHERDLAKDVLRAEAVVKTLSTDLRSVINEIRKKTKVLMAERRHSIYEIVQRQLAKEGDFVHLQDDRRFYVPRETGKPTEIEMMSEPLHSLLDIKFGLNPTEPEHTYSMRSLISYTGQLPETAVATTLSYYDQHSNLVLIHGGRKDVYAVTPEGQHTVANGEYSVLFPWDRIVEPFIPSYDPTIDWASILFDLPNVVGMTPEEARCALKVWLLFSLLRDAATSRPLLAFFGQPGSGKTSTARKLYAFFYGRHMDVSGATSPTHYDMATANLPFYVLDNLDTWEKWIPDRLAQSAGKSDVIVRKLYTNNQVVRIKRQAMVCVTAHDPKFGRADVTDRMLIINLQRFSNLGLDFKDEGTLIDQVLTQRNKLWGSVLHDLQLVLSTPIAPETDLQLRIQDYARLGEWIATALGDRELFRSAVSALTHAQRSFNLDDDHILIHTLQRWLSKTGGCIHLDQDQLFGQVTACVTAEDAKMFQSLYKSSSMFSKRISNLQDTLNKTGFVVEIENNDQGQRLWSIHSAS